VIRKICCFVMALSVCPALFASSFAQTPTPSPTFQPAAGAIVSGLSGLVTGAGPALGSDRATSRMLAFRLQLTNLLLSAGPGEKISLGALKADKTDYVLSNSAILCDVRGTHAVVAADGAYINTVTGTLDKFATSPKIATISDALESVFQNYSINVPSGGKKGDAAANVRQSCLIDIDNWPSAVYGRPIKNENLTSATASSLAVGNDISAVITLYQAIVSLVTPLVTIPATARDAKTRADAIVAFLKQYRTTLLNAAEELAATATKVATTTRLQALGQFAEKMSAARSINVDLSKIPACESGLQNPILRQGETKDSNGNVTGTSYIPTDAFVICYAQAWQQLLDASNAAVVAATQYDTLADTSSDQLQAAVSTIRSNLGKLDQPASVNITDLSNAAALLITYGTAVGQSLSSTNLAKVQTDLDNVLKLFGSK
jgi:hypothetical protein